MVVGDDGVPVVDAQATPAMARDVIARVRTVTDRSIKHLVSSHDHAIRVPSASASSAHEGAKIVASDATRELIVERGR